MKNENRQCNKCKNEFTLQEDDFAFYEKMKVPSPTFCPQCRMIRRFNWRNERNLFRRPDAHNGQEIFSGFSPYANVLTYENTYWYSDGYDQLETGRNYDFTKNFFDQLHELLSVAPLPARSIYNLINSDYCNEASEAKNCYLSFNIDFVENSSYVNKVTYTKDSFDLFEGTENELCYDNVSVDKSYHTMYSLDCDSCVDVYFSKGLRGCTNCFGCCNLRNKSYYIFNQPYTREEYNEEIKKFNLDSYKSILSIKDKVKEFWLQFPNKYYHGLRIVDSNGEKIFDSRNTRDCYTVRGAENVRYCQDLQPKASNCYDYSVWGSGAENIYECMTCGIGCYNLKFCFNCYNDVSDLEYCIFCIASHDCFGCVGLYKKSFCIFNKQYTKEEYFILVDKIKKQMTDLPFVDSYGREYRYGEYFPSNMCPVGYNESIAFDFFPLSKEDSISKGFNWHESTRKSYDTTIDNKDLPDSINDTTENITNEIIKCKDCSRAYRITAVEFQFYKRFSIPLPRKCHECRFNDRFKLINPPVFYTRSCMCKEINHTHGDKKCDAEFETSYAPERPEIVYCEKCYQSEVL